MKKKYDNLPCFSSPKLGKYSLFFANGARGCCKIFNIRDKISKKYWKVFDILNDIVQKYLKLKNKKKNSDDIQPKQVKCSKIIDKFIVDSLLLIFPPFFTMNFFLPPPGGDFNLFNNNFPFPTDRPSTSRFFYDGLKYFEWSSCPNCINSARWQGAFISFLWIFRYMQGFIQYLFWNYIEVQRVELDLSILTP